MTKQATKNTRSARKTPAKKASVALLDTRQHHDAPDTLSARAVEIWIQVVTTLPREHFLRSDLPLLAEYCETAAIIERMRARWSGEVTVIKNNGDEVVAPTLTAINRNQQCLAQLAGKLRICPSSRLSASKAGHEKAKPKSIRAGLMK